MPPRKSAPRLRASSKRRASSSLRRKVKKSPSSSHSLPLGATKRMLRMGCAFFRTAASRPTPLRIARLSSRRPSPHIFSLGKVARSTTRTLTPLLASSMAAMQPAGPAPTTRTSVRRAWFNVSPTLLTRAKNEIIDRPQHYNRKARIRKQEPFP